MVQEWSPVWRILSAYRNTARKQDKCLVTFFFKKPELFLECLHAPPRCNGVYFKLLTMACRCYPIKCLIILYIPLWKICFCHIWLERLRLYSGPFASRARTVDSGQLHRNIVEHSKV